MTLDTFSDDIKLGLKDLERNMEAMVSESNTKSTRHIASANEKEKIFKEEKKSFLEFVTHRLSEFEETVMKAKPVSDATEEDKQKYANALDGSTAILQDLRTWIGSIFDGLQAIMQQFATWIKTKAQTC
ncbi:unnamed protein product, partial [Rotaria socialis]